MLSELSYRCYRSLFSPLCEQFLTMKHKSSLRDPLVITPRYFSLQHYNLVKVLASSSPHLWQILPHEPKQKPADHPIHIFRNIKHPWVFLQCLEEHNMNTILKHFHLLS